MRAGVITSRATAAIIAATITARRLRTRARARGSRRASPGATQGPAATNRKAHASSVGRRDVDDTEAVRRQRNHGVGQLLEKDL
eukprot:6393066-Prymnesium_polylepis.1